MTAHPEPYISRLAAEEFLGAIATSLQQPVQSPLLFHIWGTGGVGKTRLRKKLIELQGANADILWVSLGDRQTSEHPLEVMKLLYDRLPQPDIWRKDLLSEDPFLSIQEKYQRTQQQLETQPLKEGTAVTPEQLSQVKQVLKIGVDAAEWLGLVKPAAEVARTMSDRGVDAIAATLSLKDNLVKLLQEHPATQKDAKLRELMLNPVAMLSSAFVEGLKQRAKKRPVVVLLDTYEKVPLEVNLWFRRLLTDHQELQQVKLRFVVMGRFCLWDREEGWRKYKQDYRSIFERELETFSPQQTTEYLQSTSVTDSPEAIHRITKGLPYYLNWVREEQSIGRKLNFAEGNTEITRLLLQGLSPAEADVVQVAACCRWFDRPLIDFLMQQLQIAPLPEPDCFTWLTQQTFVERIDTVFRLDDVARDTFRQSLKQNYPERFDRIYAALTRYFKARSDAVVPASACPSHQYNNPDWRKHRSDYLYYLLWTQDSRLSTRVVSHLLEARYFRQDDLLHEPFAEVFTEASSAITQLIPYTTQQFLQQIEPAVLSGWRVLEAEPLDYPWLMQKEGWEKTRVDAAVRICLVDWEALQGLAKFMALYCQSKRCPVPEAYQWLQRAQEQASHICSASDIEFSSDLFLLRIGNSL